MPTPMLHDRIAAPIRSASVANRIPCLESLLSATDSKAKSNPRPICTRIRFPANAWPTSAPPASTEGVRATLVVARPRSGGIGGSAAGRVPNGVPPAGAWGPQAPREKPPRAGGPNHGRNTGPSLPSRGVIGDATPCLQLVSRTFFRPISLPATPRRLSPPCFAPHSSPICDRRLKPATATQSQAAPQLKGSLNRCNSKLPPAPTRNNLRSTSKLHRAFPTAGTASPGTDELEKNS